MLIDYFCFVLLFIANQLGKMAVGQHCTLV
jgi:hypothetical protein